MWELAAVAPVGPGAIGPGVCAFPGITGAGNWFPRTPLLGSSVNRGSGRPLARCNRFGYDTKEGAGKGNWSITGPNMYQICGAPAPTNDLVSTQALRKSNVNRAQPKLDYA